MKSEPATPAPAARDQAAFTRSELRMIAGARATVHGHVLGTWRDINGGEIEVAHCRRCWDSAVVDECHAPHLAGPAISQRCVPRRPDAFLANQHESVTRGGSR